MQTATMSERAMNLSFLGMFASMLTALDVVSLIILVIMMMILGNTIAMGVRERTREYGVLRAIGFEPGHIRLFVIGEAVALGLLAGRRRAWRWPIPIVELGMGRFLEENMGAWFPYFRVDGKTYALAIGCAVGLAVAASIIPARARRPAAGDRRPPARGLGGAIMIPISYNLRNLTVRKTTTLAAALGLALVVFVFAAALMLVERHQEDARAQRQPRRRPRPAQGRHRRAGERDHRGAEHQPGPERQDAGRRRPSARAASPR